MKNVMYAVNTTDGVVIPAGSVYSPTTVVRHSGCNTRLAEGGIVIDGSGYYNINAVATLVAGADGVIDVSLMQGGVEIYGAKSSVTVESDATVSVPVNAVVKINCPCVADAITVFVDGVATTGNNLSIVVEKI